MVVACSATESTNGSVVVRNGFIAFKYRKLGNGNKLESSLVTIRMEPIINRAHNKINPLRVFVSFLLNFWIIIQIIKKIVAPSNENPPKPNTNPGPGLSNNKIVDKNDITKRGMLQSKKSWSFLIKGKARMKTPMGITKNWIPPHEARPKLKIIPAPIILETAIFLFSVFIPLKNKYSHNNP